MLFDLLRFASIGQNMELIASIHQARQHHHQNCDGQQKQSQSTTQVGATPQRCSRTHLDYSHCNEDYRHLEVNAPSNQCKPLDLTLKNTTELHARQLSNKAHSMRLAPLIIEDHGRLPNVSEIQFGNLTKRTGLGLGQRRKRNIAKERPLSIDQQAPHSVARLISSSTSPSTCSRSGSASSISASSSESKSCNDLISSTNNNLVSSPANTKTVKPATATTTTTTTTTTMTSKRQKQKNLKSHLCQQCGRSFSRSDMLTRHSRLHSGLKPYQCGKCKQVFSRSDHLSTHERTHTGEKPYQCEQCAYSACRRDMITRHMRTHSASLTDPTKAIRRHTSTDKSDHTDLIDRIDCIKSEFNFEQEDISSSLDDNNSAITGDDDGSDVGRES